MMLKRTIKQYLFHFVVCITALFACATSQTKDMHAKGVSPMDVTGAGNIDGVLSNKDIIRPQVEPEETVIDQGVEKQNKPRPTR